VSVGGRHLGTFLRRRNTRRREDYGSSSRREEGRLFWRLEKGSRKARVYGLLHYGGDEGKQGAARMAYLKTDIPRIMMGSRNQIDVRPPGTVYRR